jgi:hypothetical protein
MERDEPRWAIPNKDVRKFNRPELAMLRPDPNLPIDRREREEPKFEKSSSEVFPESLWGASLAMDKPRPKRPKCLMLILDPKLRKSSTVRELPNNPIPYRERLLPARTKERMESEDPLEAADSADKARPCRLKP